jgi:hypothetical protein
MTMISYASLLSSRQMVPECIMTLSLPCLCPFTPVRTFKSPILSCFLDVLGESFYMATTHKDGKNLLFALTYGAWVAHVCALHSLPQYPTTVEENCWGLLGEFDLVNAFAESSHSKKN